MLPIFHIIGNVSKNADNSIKLESINDCSGVTYHGGLYHVFHQCCQKCVITSCASLPANLANPPFLMRARPATLTTSSRRT